MSLDAQGTEGHSAGNEVLHDALHRLDLVDRCRLSGLLESEEVADEYGTLFFIYNLCPILEFVVVALTGRQLQLCNCLWVPSVLDAVLAPSKLTLVL